MYLKNKTWNPIDMAALLSSLINLSIRIRLFGHHKGGREDFKCAKCGKKLGAVRTCKNCGRAFCEDHISQGLCGKCQKENSSQMIVADESNQDQREDQNEDQQEDQKNTDDGQKDQSEEEDDNQDKCFKCGKPDDDGYSCDYCGEFFCRDHINKTERCKKCQKKYEKENTCHQCGVVEDDIGKCDDCEKPFCEEHLNEDGRCEECQDKIDAFLTCAKCKMIVGDEDQIYKCTDCNDLFCGDHINQNDRCDACQAKIDVKEGVQQEDVEP